MKRIIALLAVAAAVFVACELETPAGDPAGVFPVGAGLYEFGAGSHQPEVLVDPSVYPDGSGEFVGVQFYINEQVDARHSARPNGVDATGPNEGSRFHIYPSYNFQACDTVAARWFHSGVEYGAVAQVPGDCPPPPTTTTAPPSTTTTTVPVTTTTATPTTTTTVPTTTTQPPSTGFFEDFTDPASMGRFDTVTWARDNVLGGGLDTGVGFDADHAVVAGGNDPDNCTNPFSARFLGRPTADTVLIQPTDHVYRCAPGDNPAAGHMMVAQGSTSGYDFSAAWTQQTFSGATEVSWDQNITNLGGRNWSEVKIVPASQWNPVRPPCAHPNVPCWASAAAGGTGDGTVITAVDTGATIMSWHNIRPRVRTAAGEFKGSKAWQSGAIRQAMEAQWQASTSPVERFRHTLTDNGNGTITLSIDTRTADYGVQNVATAVGSFPDEPFVVVFSTHDYSSSKGDESGYDGFTWHFDNIAVS